MFYVKDIILAGSLEVQMPYTYQAYLEQIPIYEPPKTRRRKFGATLFLKVWSPVMAIMESLTNATIRDDGYVPGFVKWLVRCTMFLIWFTHDYFFAPLFGRGDGNEDEEAQALDQEQEPLLEKTDNRKSYLEEKRKAFHVV